MRYIHGILPPAHQTENRNRKLQCKLISRKSSVQISHLKQLLPNNFAFEVFYDSDSVHTEEEKQRAVIHNDEETGGVWRPSRNRSYFD